MKAHLMFRQDDFDLDQAGPAGEAALVQDLELETLFAAMAAGDKWLDGVIRKAVLASVTDVGTIEYRQAVLRDCLAQEDVVRHIYDLAFETIENQRKNFYWSAFSSPGSTLQGSVSVLQMFMEMLRRLREIVDGTHERFRSEGFRTLFSMLRVELDDDYLAGIRDHLKRLRFAHGVLISARLGEGGKGTDYVLRRENPPKGNFLERLFTPGPPSFSFRLHERDEAGARALSDLKDRGLNLVANALAQSTDHILSFFKMLRVELAFYVGVLNLRRRIAVLDMPFCFPHATMNTDRDHHAAGLYDVCLALSIGRKVVGNSLAADGKSLVIVTGANQGGKSTFLRSIGLAQVMTQCGMFVAASAFRVNVAAQVFTHYKREEDASMTSGKFDEELSRMSGIVDRLTPDSVVLFNESFSATNEREGSEIARQIVSGLIERGVKVFFVTHQYEFARSFQSRAASDVLFLRAERQEGGTRTFKVIEGDPLQTSYGEDLYRQVFKVADAA